MDHHNDYNRQLEYYQYVEQQKENFIDLTKDVPEDDPNDNIRQFAERLFSKREKDLKYDLSGILMDDTMVIADVFCMLVEIILYGLNVLTDKTATLFDWTDSTNDRIYSIKHYLRSTGLDMDVYEEIVDIDKINLYRDRSDYYCEIVKRPPPFLCHPGWYVLNYRLINNRKFIYDEHTPLELFRAFFISTDKKIFRINFKFSR